MAVYSCPRRFRKVFPEWRGFLFDEYQEKHHFFGQLAEYALGEGFGG